MKIEIEVTGCHDCPYLKWDKLCNDDGSPYYSKYEYCYCRKGAFGISCTNKEKIEKYSQIPKYPPKECPYYGFIVVDPLDKFIQETELDLTKEELKEILDRCNLKIVDK